LRKPRILLTAWAGEQNQESPYSDCYHSGDKIGARIIAEGLAKKGYEVHFFSLSNQTKDFQANQVFIHHLQNPTKAPKVKWKPADILRYTPLFFDFFVAALVRTIWRYDIDVVLARTVHLNATGAFEAAKRTGRPILSTLAERDFLNFFPKSKFPPHLPSVFPAASFYINQNSKNNSKFREFNRSHQKRVAELFLKANGLSVLSAHLIKDIKLVSRKHAATHVIPDGVQKRFFNSVSRKKSDNLSILCVARLSPYKRQDLAVRAFAEIAKKNKRVKLLLAGDGPYRRPLEKMITKAGLKNRVLLLGFQPYEKVAKLTAQADIIISPTDSEGLPLTLLEAMAAGKPVVASKVPPYTEIIRHGKNGLLAKNNAGEFRIMLQRLLSDPEERKKIGREARKTANRFTWQNSINLTERAIKSIWKKEQR